MKRFKNTALLVALMCITLATVGCGGNQNSPSGPGGTVIGGGTVIPGGTIPGTVTPLPGGGGQVTFSGNNVYNSGVRIAGSTPGFNPGTQGTLVLGSVNIPVGQPGTLGGESRFYPGTTIALTTVAIPGNPLASNIAGVVTISPQFVAANPAAFPQGTGGVQGIALDVYISGGKIYSGGVWICTTRDQQGYCHGAYVEF